MAHKLDNCLVVGISSRALFDLEEENNIYLNEGIDSYTKYQIDHEKDILKPGAGFLLVKALLKLNELSEDKKTEIVIMSRNNPATSLRIFNSIKEYDLDITRAVMSSGTSLARYLNAFKTDLYLSANESDVQSAINSNVAAGIICTDNFPVVNVGDSIKEIKIAFDGDAVLFSDESERIFKEKGLEAFLENERINATNPLHKGPFAKLLKTLSDIQKQNNKGIVSIRTALVTARNAPAHERVIRTLKEWDVRIDEAFFLGGISKSDILNAFGAHIFFDDQTIHLKGASDYVPTARVPLKND